MYAQQVDRTLEKVKFLDLKLVPIIAPQKAVGDRAKYSCGGYSIVTQYVAEIPQFVSY